MQEKTILSNNQHKDYSKEKAVLLTKEWRHNQKKEGHPAPKK